MEESILMLVEKFLISAAETLIIKILHLIVTELESRNYKKDKVPLPKS